jgi:hypothetical protein
MPESKKRGGRKQHNKRIKKRNEHRTFIQKSIKALKMKIIEEAKQRYEEEKNNKQTTWKEV